MKINILLLVIYASGCTCPQQFFMETQTKYVDGLTNWIQADSEASKYGDVESSARLYLQELRNMPFINIPAKLVADGFHWRAEAWDYTSYAWVTIAKRRGDCDDFREVWREALRYRGETWRVTVASTDLSAHAMLLFKPAGSNILYIMSNLNILGSRADDNWEALVRLFYGDKTGCYIRY
jgi:predicted transglutaminase-like cysteine proteinase